MVSEGVKFKYLDASALVKLYINENDSQQLRDFLTKPLTTLQPGFALLKRSGF